MSNTTREAIVAHPGSTRGTLAPEVLRAQANPALARLATAVAAREAEAETTNYSRTHHRHARSHTRR